MLLSLHKNFVYTLVLLSLLTLAGSSFAGFRPTFKELPLAVQETVTKEAPSDKIQRIYRTLYAGRPKPDYYVVLRTEKKQIILWMTNEGKILSRKEGPIPAFVELLKPPPGSVL